MDTQQDSGGQEDRRPLDGIRVVELTQWIAGPSAAGLLADWGADVVKVEAPSGDPQRGFLAALGVAKKLPNPSFAQDNRGKRSVVLDLNTNEGLQTFDRLLTTADVFLTNWRPNALERLRLDPASVRERHASLVIASQTGYGPVGPDRDTPGYDIGAFIARTGMARTNRPEQDDPVNLKGGIGDHMTGITTCMAVLAALMGRERTGEGQVVETSLFQTGLYAVSVDLATQMTFGRLARMRPRTELSTPLVNCYKTADDKWFYLIGVEAARHLPGVGAAIGWPDITDDERFSTAPNMMENKVELIRLLDEAFATRDLAYWAQKFEEFDVWWAPCQTMAEVAQDPQALALDSFIPVTDGDGDNLMTIAAPVIYNGSTLKPRRMVPALGEHTDEVLAELDHIAE
ncbi:MAG: CoA transferase [Acidimicrobiia bacterium]|nr:CoA transferase [Acidimicrobiia bacterium]MDH5291022.1 CoA transferase [Acidimicrobiia bacterium]